MYGAALAAFTGLSLVSWEGYHHDERSARYGNSFASISATNGNGIMPSSKGFTSPRISKRLCYTDGHKFFESAESCRNIPIHALGPDCGTSQTQSH